MVIYVIMFSVKIGFTILHRFAINPFTLQVFIERLSTTRFVHVDRYQSVAIKQNLSPGSFVTQIRTNSSNCRFQLGTENTPFEIDDINGKML